MSKLVVHSSIICHYIVRDYILVHQVANIGFTLGDCCIVCCHLPDTRKPCIENRSVQTGSAYYLIIAFSVTLLSQLGGNKDHSTKICESWLTCMLVAVRSECEFVRKFPLKYSRGHRLYIDMDTCCISVCMQTCAPYLTLLYLRASLYPGNAVSATSSAGRISVTKHFHLQWPVGIDKLCHVKNAVRISSSLSRISQDLWFGWWTDNYRAVS